MKTNVVMIRQMGEFEVSQRTQDGYFDAKALERLWNTKEGNKTKEIRAFLENEKTKEFIVELEKNLSSGENYSTANQVVIHKPSKASKVGRTKEEYWMHPYLFIDFAMWLNPSFKYHVLKFVYDQLIQTRKESGDSYKKMCDALYQKIPVKQDFPKYITGIAYQIKQACKVDSWETASEEQLELRKKIEDTASMIADYVHYDDVVSEAIKKNNYGTN